MPVIARTRPDFRGRLMLQGLNEDVLLTRAQSGGPMQTIRTGRMAARNSGDHLICFCIHVAGRGHVRQHDRVAELAAGSGVLYEARSPWELASPADSQSLTLNFSRELLPMRAAEITAACARSMDPQSPTMQMLSGYLGRLYQLADRLTADQRLDAGHAAIDLLGMALRDVRPSVPDGEGSTDVLLDMMRVHVRNHLADPLLTVEELARRHHISTRHAYALFARAGTTPGAFIREQRLLAACALLTDPGYDRKSVSGIAAATGFTEPTTFQRAFRRQYGMTPANWRRERRAARHDAPPAVDARDR